MLLIILPCLVSCHEVLSWTYASLTLLLYSCQLVTKHFMSFQCNIYFKQDRCYYNELELLNQEFV
jgi:hypothetical protein